MYGKCTVYFEDPYWVGFFERCDENGYSVARFVFGAEPSEVELCHFSLRDFQNLVFSLPGLVPEQEEAELSFKRRQRQVHRQMAQAGAGTFAQRALQAERERMKQVRREETRAEREAGEREKYLRKQAQKKEKHRGR